MLGVSTCRLVPSWPLHNEFSGPGRSNGHARDAMPFVCIYTTCCCGAPVSRLQEAKTTLARLCQHYSFELAPGQVRAACTCVQ